jgi:phosphoserine aminotransferase
MSGLRGHRSVGGMRASIYNAFPEEGVHRLVQLLDEIEREAG